MIKPDEQLIREFEEFMAANPYANRHQISRALKVGLERLGRLVKLPPKISKSAAGTMARKQGGWGKNFRLKGSPKI